MALPLGTYCLIVEADLVLSEETALAESNRCLSCCRLCYNKDKAAA